MNEVNWTLCKRVDMRRRYAPQICAADLRRRSAPQDFASIASAQIGAARRRNAPHGADAAIQVTQNFVFKEP